jgi:hypothetical protein
VGISESVRRRHQTFPRAGSGVRGRAGETSEHFLASLFGLAAALSIGLLAGCQATPAAAPIERPVVVNFQEDFQLQEPSDAWKFRTPELWRIAQEGDRRFIQMAMPPPRKTMSGVRRPQEYGIYDKYEFRSFNLSCRVRIDRDLSTPTRDAVIIFGRRDNTHMYYAHLSSIANSVHNNLVRLDGETRQVLIPKAEQPKPAIADKEWHKVDVQRDCDTGDIKVYVDAFQRDDPPLFHAVDKTYDWGFIGVGSFDDHASFTHLMIEGEGRSPQAPVVPDPP